MGDVCASQVCAPRARSLYEKRAAEVETLAGVLAVSHDAAPHSAGEEADVGCAAPWVYLSIETRAWVS